MGVHNKASGVLTLCGHNPEFVALREPCLRRSPNSNRLCRDCQRLFSSSSRTAESRVLFRAEFLETRIASERIEHRIEPEQRRSEWHSPSQRTSVRYRE